jgi:hypothetical protein
MDVPAASRARWSQYCTSRGKADGEIAAGAYPDRIGCRTSREFCSFRGSAARLLGASHHFAISHRDFDVAIDDAVQSIVNIADDAADRDDGARPNFGQRVASQRIEPAADMHAANHLRRVQSGIEMHDVTADAVPLDRRHRAGHLDPVVHEGRIRQGIVKRANLEHVQRRGLRGLDRQRSGGDQDGGVHGVNSSWELDITTPIFGVFVTNVNLPERRCLRCLTPSRGLFSSLNSGFW